jgi:hypothetical protein
MRYLFATAICAAAIVCSYGQTPLADKTQLAAFEKEYLHAKALMKSHPNDPGARSFFVRAGDRFATATMTSNVLAPRVKYPKALRLYREVLKVDPHNREAMANAKLIEDVYRSMHRPIPK